MRPPTHARKFAAGDNDAAIPADRARYNAAVAGSRALRDRLNWQFQREADRLRVPLADARLLLNNGVRL